MSGRAQAFRIAVRKYGPFEAAIRKQWHSFDQQAHTGLHLELTALELHPLEDALFRSGGMLRGDWDVAFINTDWIAAMHASGAALNLEPWLVRDAPPEYPHGWMDSLLRLQRMGNAVLGTPYHDGPECLIYRKDIFEDAATQRQYQQQYGEALAPPRTWEEFHRIARFLHAPEKGLYGTIFAGLPDGHNSVYDFLLQLWTRGGELFDADGRIRFATPQAAEALEFYRAMMGDANAVHPQCHTMDSIQAGMAFAAGEVAMMVNWFGFATMAHTAQESNVRGCVDVAEVPQGSGGRSVSLNVYWLLSIASGSPHPEIAFQFLRWCMHAEMDKLTTMEGAIGCRRSTWEDEDVNAQIPFYRRMAALHACAREIPQMQEWPQIARVIDTLVTDAIATRTPVSTLLQEAEASAAVLF
ncbi:MAG: extracellular solute-binding protein [Acidobacteriaceae bacterium]